jgi:hypothetical protein
MSRKAIDLTGQRFERLVVLKRAGRDKYYNALWTVRCDCGQSKIVLAKSLRTAGTKSCGCLCKEEMAKGHNLKHGHCSKEESSPTYVSWHNMRSRCLNPNGKDFKDYGGRGVTICDRWNRDNGGSFEKFLADMGERPLGTTLGRFGDTGNYTPLNCKWMTQAEQVANWRPDRCKPRMAA